MAPENKTSRFLVLAFVGVFHLALILLWLRVQQWPLGNPATQPLTLLDLASSAAKPVSPVPQQIDASAVSRTKSKKAHDNEQVPDSQPDAEGASSPFSSLPAGRPPPIDWDNEAEQASKSRAASIFQQLQQACKKAALKGEQPPECRTHKTPDAWVPEPKKFDISGGLPFMRLGKFCVIGLGFFGCAVGKLPEANSHVLDDMRDPDRPRSSVPSTNE